MKKIYNAVFVFIALIAFTGCEAGLGQDDAGGNNGDGFSFSEIYGNMARMRVEIDDLLEKINEHDPAGTVNAFAGTTTPNGLAYV